MHPRARRRSEATAAFGKSAQAQGGWEGGKSIKHTFRGEDEDKQREEWKKTKGVGNGHSREGDVGKLVLTSDNERGIKWNPSNIYF